jgi:O-antigen ligase
MRGKGLVSLPTAIVLVELAAIVITYFRAAWIAAVIIIVCAVAYRFRSGLRPATVVAVVAVLALVAFGLSRIESVTKRLENSENVTGRIATWGQDLNVFATAPAFGVGVEDFTASTSDSTDVVVSGVRALDQPHSSYLGLLAEQGVVGFLPFLVLTFAVAWMVRALRKRSADDAIAAIRACLLGAGLAFLVMSLTLTLLPRGSSSALFALLIGGAAAQLDRLGARERRPEDQAA